MGVHSAAVYEAWWQGAKLF